VTRQLVSDGTGLIAQCTTTTTSATVLLDPTGLGYDAIVRGFLYPGLPVDIGTTSDTDTVVTGAVIQSVNESATAPSITIDSAVSTTGSHYVSIANPNSTTVANPELNGFRNIISNNALGGLNPATAGEEFWAPAKLDTTTTTLSLNLALTLQRAVHQKTGSMDGEVWTSLKQQQNWYELLQSQVRFDGDVNIGAGASDSAKWRGVVPRAIPEIYDRDWFVIRMSDLKRIQGAIKAPTWVTDLEGNGAQGLVWGPGTTSFSSAVVWPWQLGVQRRNGTAGATNLTA
jgi:hypothetical protein